MAPIAGDDLDVVSGRAVGPPTGLFRDEGTADLAGELVRGVFHVMVPLIDGEGMGEVSLPLGLVLFGEGKDPFLLHGCPIPGNVFPRFHRGRRIWMIPLDLDGDLLGGFPGEDSLPTDLSDGPDRGILIHGWDGDGCAVGGNRDGGHGWILQN